MEQQISPANTSSTGDNKNLPNFMLFLQRSSKKTKIVFSLITIIILVGLAFLISNKKNPLKVSSGKPPTNITLKSEYKNPFKQSTQYVNPFTEFKSPFINLQ